MKCPLCVQQSASTRVCARKLDDGFHSLATRAAKKCFGHGSPGQPAQARRKFTGKLRNMTLEHRRTAAIKFGFERRDDRRMVMADVVNAISREKIQNAVALSGLQFRALAP